MQIQFLAGFLLLMTLLVFGKFKNPRFKLLLNVLVLAVAMIMFWHPMFLGFFTNSKVESVFVLGIILLAYLGGIIADYYTKDPTEDKQRKSFFTFRAVVVGVLACSIVLKLTVF